MATAEHQHRARKGGYVIVLGGVGVFTVGSWLPLFKLATPITANLAGLGFNISESTLHIALHPAFTQGPLGVGSQLLGLYLGPLVIAALALLALAPGVRPSWLPAGLAIAVALWGASQMSLLIQYGSPNPGFAHATGYWLLVSGLVLVVIGSVVALASGRVARDESASQAPESSGSTPISV